MRNTVSNVEKMTYNLKLYWYKRYKSLPVYQPLTDCFSGNSLCITEEKSISGVAPFVFDASPWQVLASCTKLKLLFKV